MSDPEQEQIEQLLSKGLDHYAEDDVSAAIVTWNRVLELDPGNAQALDYIRNADRRSAAGSAADEPAAGAGASANQTLLREARVLMAESQWAAALELMRGGEHQDAQALDVEAMIDLARSRLFLEHRATVGDLSSVPRLKADAGALTNYNLPTDAGFLLSMVDGMTSVEDLVSLSGMDAFDTLHSLCGLLEAGIVEMSA